LRLRFETAETSGRVATYGYQYNISGGLINTQIALSGVVADGSPVPMDLAATYDFNGNRTELYATIGGTYDFVNTYSYDDGWGDLVSITQAGEVGGNEVTGKEVDFGYDYDQRLTSEQMYQDVDGTSTLIASAAYAYDGDSNLTDLKYGSSE
jgi:hypothetical protein